MTTLLSLVEALARDPEAKADYAAGPDAYLDRHGFGDLSPADVNEAVHHASNTLPPAAAAQVDPQDGLASVAQVEPDAFEPGTANDFEDDLFGLDPGAEDGFDGVDDGLDGGVDHLAHDGVDDDGVDDDGVDDDGVDDAFGQGARGDVTPDGHQGTDAAHHDGQAGPDADGPDGTDQARQLATLNDPHDLDGDEASDAPPGDGQAAAPEAAAVLGHDDLSPGDDGTDDASSLEPVDLDGPDGIDGPDGADELDTFAPDGGVGLDPTALMADDPFGSDPLAVEEEPWYAQSGDDGYDVAPPEPEDDILDDVDDIHVNGQ